MCISFVYLCNYDLSCLIPQWANSQYNIQKIPNLETVLLTLLFMKYAII